MKTKIKSHSDEVTDFYHKEILKEDSNHNCLAIISLDFVLKRDENNYRQYFLKECRYTARKVVKHIHDNLSDFCFSHADESDEEQIRINKACVPKNIKHYFSNRECTQKSVLYI